MPKFYLLMLLMAYVNISYGNCLNNIFKNGSGHLSNYYHLDEPSECCSNIYASAKLALIEVLKTQILCSDQEASVLASGSINCLEKGQVCEIKLVESTIVAQIAIEHGAQPVTHVIFNDNH